MMQSLSDFFSTFRHRGTVATAHTWSTRWVHWAAALLLVFSAIANGENSGALFKSSAMMTEVFVGIGIAILYGYLWFWVRRSGGGSRLPKDAPRWEQMLARIVHYTIYASIAAILVSGFAMAYLAPTDVVVNVPAQRIISMTTEFSFVRAFHRFMSVALGGALGLHIAGAFWHRLVRRDGVMQSIGLWGKKKAEG